MEDFRDLKRAARQSLRGMWGTSALLLLLLRVPGLLAGLTEQGIRMAAKVPAFEDGAFASANPDLPAMTAALGCGILCFLLWAPLFHGRARWYWRVRSEPQKVRAVFFYFESWRTCGKTVWLTLNVCLRALWWYLLFCLPGAVAGGMLFWLRYRMGPSVTLGAVEPLFTALLFIWPLLAAVLAAAVSQRYFLVPRLLAEKPADPAGRILRKSVRLMRGYQARVLLLRLSFWPWYLPGLAAAGCVFGGLIQPFPAPFWTAAVLAVAQMLFGFYWKPLRAAVLARCAGEILYGALAETENVTREYCTKSQEMTLPEMPGFATGLFSPEKIMRSQPD